MTDLPTSPAELSLLCRRIEVHARKLADDADRQVFEQRPESVRDAAKAAVSCLYFHGDKDAERLSGVMRKMVSLIAPEIHRLMYEQGDRVAYRVVVGDPDDPDYEEPEPDEPPPTVRTEPPAPGPAERRIDALLESLGGPLPKAEVTPEDMSEIFAPDEEPALTTTQANLLAFLHAHPRGFGADRLAHAVDNITDGHASDSVIAVYRAALGVLLERGLARKHGALVLAKDAPDPVEDTAPTGFSDDEKTRIRQHLGYAHIADPHTVVLDDLRATPRSTAAEIAKRTELPVKDVRQALRALPVVGEGKTRGRRYWVK